VYELVVIGASWGGLDAVGRVLAELPGDFPVPVVVVQHRSPHSRGGTLEAMLAVGGLPVREVDDKDPIVPGAAYVAPADYHLIVEPGNFALSVDERVQHSRPSIDVTFETAADSYGSRLIGVVLTGANEDGAAGLRTVMERGGVTIVQDPAGAAKPTMPQAAIDAGAAQRVLPLEEIPPFLVAACGDTRRAA
jgi:two-component system chemotaxis response regulator CheB